LIGFVIYFSPVLLDGKLLAPGDDLTEFLPQFLAPRYLWSNVMLCGFPQAADPQSQYFYPLSCLSVLGTFGWNLMVILPYVLAAAFTYGYLYSLTKAKAASAFGALIFSTGGFFISNLRHLTLMHAACWLPLAIWSIAELKKKITPYWFFLTSFSAALLILAGHAQTMGYALTLLCAFAICQSCSSEAGRFKVDFRFLAFSFLALFFSLGIGAVQLLPTLELTETTERLKHGLEFYNYFRFFPFEYVLFVFPCFFGTDKTTFYGYDWVGPANFVSAGCYVGMAALLLVPLAFISNAERKLKIFWLVVAILCGFLVLGSENVIGAIAYYYPPYKIFRVPTRHFLEMSFAIAVLACFGFRAIEARLVTNRTLKILIASSIVVFIAALLSAIAMLPVLVKAVTENKLGHLALSLWHTPSLVVPIIVLIASIISLVLLVRQPQSRSRRIVFLLVAFLDLASFGQFCEWRTNPCDPAVTQIPDYAIKYKEALSHSNQRAANVSGNGGTISELLSNLSALWDVPTINSYQPLLSARAKRFFCMFAGGFIECDLAVENDHSLDVGSVRYVFVPKTDNAFTSISTNSARWHLKEELLTTLVYENMKAMPRVWLVPKVEQVPPDKSILAIHTSRDFDPHAVAFVEEPVEVGGSANTTDSAKLLSVTNGTMTISTSTKTPQLLVTSDSYYPGWEAQIDGKPARIYQADYLFRAVLVPAGEHTVHFDYKPKSLEKGLAISALSALFLAFTCLFLRKKE
jgi:Bacterial membrane protein YfhO